MHIGRAHHVNILYHHTGRVGRLACHLMAVRTYGLPLSMLYTYEHSPSCRIQPRGHYQVVETSYGTEHGTGRFAPILELRHESGSGDDGGKKVQLGCFRLPHGRYRTY